MGRFAKIKIVQVPDEKAPEKLSPAEMEQVKEIEGKRILDKIKDKEYVYVTAIKGKERTSEDFAKELADLTTYGHSDITMPHQLMRLVLVEQIYRAFMINSGSPYHK